MPKAFAAAAAATDASEFEPEEEQLLELLQFFSVMVKPPKDVRQFFVPLLSVYAKEGILVKKIGQT